MGAPDAAVDAPPEVTGAVTVFAPYRDSTGIIVPRARVLTFNEFGALVDRQATNLDGVATAQVPAGGSVVAVPPAASASHEYYEWLDVGIGDQLYTEAPRPLSPTSWDRSLTLGRDQAGATSYVVTGAAFLARTDMPAATGPITMPAWQFSDAPAMEDLVAEADYPGIARFAILPAVALNAATIDLPAPVWMPGVQVDRTFTAIPADAMSVEYDEERLENGRVAWQSGAIVPQPGLSFTVGMPTPGPFGVSALVGQVYRNAHSFAFAFNAGPTTIALDQLAPIAFDVTRGVDDSVVWQQAGHGTATGIELDLVGSVSGWHVVMPPDQLSFHMPVLPADLQIDQSMPDVTVTYIGGNDPSGYAPTRTDPNVFAPLQFGKVVPQTPGLYRFTSN